MSGASFSYEVTREFSRVTPAGLVHHAVGEVITLSREAKALTHLKPVEGPAVLASEPAKAPEGDLVVNPEAVTEAQAAAGSGDAAAPAVEAAAESEGAAQAAAPAAPVAPARKTAKAQAAAG